MTEETAQQPEDERLDFSKPPPGWAASGTAIIGGRQNEMVEEPDAPDSKARRRPLAIAWQLYKAENDPPGMWTLYWENEDRVAQGYAWGYRSEAAFGTEPTQAGARAAAWACYERRLEVWEWLVNGDVGDFWPQCMAWSNGQVDAVFTYQKAWQHWALYADIAEPKPTLACPEVLRG